jgi:hypothetical protein
MSCDGGHLGFSIGIENRKLVKDIPMIIHLQFGFRAGLSLTLHPMGKMFQNASSLKPLGQLKTNCTRMIIGKSSTKFLFFMPIGNPREHFPICSNVNLCPVMVAILDFQSA